MRRSALAFSAALAALAPIGGALAEPRAPAAAEARGSTGAPFGLWHVDRDTPLSIHADELEGTDRGGARTLHFHRNVVVTQGDVTLQADALEASYPAGAGEPDRLVAEGGVRLRQGDRGARCSRAVYDRGARRIDCVGDASLHDGDDTVRGSEIVFDLASGHVRVLGGTRLRLEPETLEEPATPQPAPAQPTVPEPAAGTASSGPALPEPAAGSAPSVSAAPQAASAAPASVFAPAGFGGKGPIDIGAKALDAFERDGAREIHFEGPVEVAQAGLALHADRLEVHYPAGARRPERLVAEGNVALRQGQRELHCARAVYHRAERRVECTGDALLREGDDEVRGDRIVFDLASQRVKVTGGSHLVMNGGESGDAGKEAP